MIQKSYSPQSHAERVTSSSNGVQMLQKSCFPQKVQSIVNIHASSSRRSHLLINIVLTNHPSTMSTQTSVTSPSSMTSRHMCNVEGQNHDSIKEKGSITSPKRCTIIIKATSSILSATSSRGV